MTKVLILHGANMNMRGKAQVEIFGKLTLDDYNARIASYAKAHGIEIDIFFSNTEGAIIDRLHAAHDEGFDAALLNPAGFTRGYGALVAAIGMVGFPTWEIHISNPARRGLHSDIATACQGTVTGFGVAGYDLAFRGILGHLGK